MLILPIYNCFTYLHHFTACIDFNKVRKNAQGCFLAFTGSGNYFVTAFGIWNRLLFCGGWYYHNNACHWKRFGKNISQIRKNTKYFKIYALGTLFRKGSWRYKTIYNGILHSAPLWNWNYGIINNVWPMSGNIIRAECPWK